MRATRRSLGVVVATLLVASVAVGAPPPPAGAAPTGFDVVGIDLAEGAEPFSSLAVHFNRPVDPATFTPDAVSVTGAEVTALTAVDPATWVVDLSGAAGATNLDLTIAATVTDADGVALDDDRNGVPGEPSDAFDALLVGAPTTLGAGGVDVTGLHVVVGPVVATAAGTLSLDGLDVASGGTLTHATYASGGTGVDLVVHRQVRVAAGGSIDATAKGLPSTPTLAGTTYGGSHGGEAGRANPGANPAETYGDPLHPTEPGRGGDDYNAAGVGGGVVRIEAGDAIVVEGAVLADGQSTTAATSTPSGGSVALEAPRLEGAGEISADGGSATTTNWSAGGVGGGGRIALWGDTIAAELVDGTRACGGQRPNAPGMIAGGAGTVLVAEGAGRRMVIDNCGRGGATAAADTPLGALEGLALGLDELVVRGGATAALTAPLLATAVHLSDHAVLTHPYTSRTTPELPHLRAAVDTLTVDATSAIDVSRRGLSGFSAFRGSTWPNTAMAASLDAGGAYGGVGERITTNAPYGDPVFPNESGAGAHVSTASLYQGAVGGGLVQVAAGELVLDGAIRADGQPGTSFSCGPSCRSYSYGGAGGGILIHAGTLSGSGSISAAGGDADGDYPDDHGTGGRVAVTAGTWAGFDPAAITALRGGAHRPVSNVSDGTVVTNGARTVGWTRPVDYSVGDDEVIFHDSEVLEWFAPAGTTASIRLSPVAGGPDLPVATGLTTRILELDTTTVPNGRYRLLLDVVAADGVTPVGSHAREVVVTNVAGVTWFDQSYIGEPTSLPGGVVFFERDVTVGTDVPIVVPADARYKFAPGVGISVFPQSQAGVPLLTSGAVLTSWYDDTLVGDTNFDGDATTPAAGDWAGIRSNGYQTTGWGVTTEPGVDIHYDVTAIRSDLPDGFVFQSDRTYLLWPRLGSFDTWTDPGEAVTIEPGAVLKGAFRATVDLNGRAEVTATGDRPAIFTSIFDDSVGGDLNRDGGLIPPAPGDLWRFEAADISNDLHLEVRYAGGSGNPVTITAPAGQPVEVDGLIVRDAVDGTVSLSASTGQPVRARNVVVDGVPRGLSVSSSNAASSVVNATIVGAARGLTYSGGTTGQLELANSTITGYAEVAVSASANRVTTTASNLYTTTPGAVPYSAAQAAGGGYVSVAPAFVDEAGGDLQLLAESPLVDAGDGNVSPPLDALDNPRVDAAAPNTGVPGPAGEVPDIGAYELQSETATLTLQRVSPATAANLGLVTFTVTGSRFTDTTTVRLVRGAAELVPDVVTHLNSTRLTARFDLAGAATGPWDLVLTDGDDSVTRTGAVTVVAGGEPGRFELHLTVPEVGRDWIAMPAVVTYRNTGDTDLPAPYVELSAQRARWFEPGTGSLVDGPIGLLAGDPAGAPDVLPPGAEGRIIVRYDIDDGLLNGQAASLLARWYTTRDSTPLDWSARRDALRPDGLSDAVWDAAWDRFVARMGSAYGNLAQQLGVAARQPGAEGRRDVAFLLDRLVAAAVGQVPIVSGTVTTADGDPAPGRTVQAHALSGATVVRSAPSDEDGRFALPGLVPGGYRLSVLGAPVAGAPAVTVTPEPLDDLTLVLAPAGGIQGTVTVDGTPAEDLPVRVRAGAAGVVAEVTTAADGTFSVDGLAPAHHVVDLVDDGGGTVATARVVVPASGTATVDLAAVGGATIEGTVTVDGAPRGDASVLVTNPATGAFTAVNTDDEGRFSTAGRTLAPGTYVVSARTDEGGDRVVVDAADGVTTTADVSIGAGAALSGTVVDADGNPMAGVSIRVDGAGTATPVRTDADGHYATVAPAGERTVFLGLDGYQPLEATVTVEADGTTFDAVLDEVNALTVAVVDGDGRPVGGVPVDVVPADGGLVGGVTGGDGRFVLRDTSDALHTVLVRSNHSPGTVLAREEIDLTDDVTVTVELPFGTLTGRVTDAGQPVDGARVALVRDSGELAVTTTDADGGYGFSVLTPGPVDVVVVNRAAQRRATVDVALGSAAVADVDLAGGAPVTVTVTGAGPLDGTGVSLLPLDGSAGALRVTTGPEGAASFTADPGAYRLRVVPPEGAVHAEEVTVGSSGLEVPVAVGAAGSLSGATGAGARVVGRHASGLEVVTVADPTGQFVLAGFPAGEVTLTAALSGRPPAVPVTATVVAGTDVAVDVPLADPADGWTVAGVVQTAGGRPLAGARVATLDVNGAEADVDLTGLDGSFTLLAGGEETTVRAHLGGAAAEVAVDVDGDAEDLLLTLGPPGATSHRFVADDGSGGGASLRSHADAFFADLSRGLDYRNFPPPERLGPDANPGFRTAWTNYGKALMDCAELGPYYTDALNRSRGVQSAFDAWQAAADAASIETGADLGEVLAEGAIVGLETTKFLAELADLWKPEGLGQMWKNDLGRGFGEGPMTNAKLSDSMKWTGLSESSLGNLDAELGLLMSVVQDSAAKFSGGDWSGGMALVDSISLSDVNALKYALSALEQGTDIPGLGAAGKVVEGLELLTKWIDFVNKQDAAFDDPGPASSYMAAMDNYLAAVQQYQAALNALAAAAASAECPPPPPPEDPPDEPCGDDCKDGPKDTRPGRPIDPNEIVGPTGVGDEGWRTDLEDLTYLVTFENLPTAEEAAIIVDIEVPLGDHVDLDSVVLGGMGWGGSDGPAAVATGGDTFTGTLDVDGPAEVVVLAELDRAARRLHWRFEARDEETGELFVDGFLPPNDPDTHVGEGWVDVTWSAVDGVVTGDAVEAQATIVFDTEDAIATNVWVNTLDITAPAATATPLPATVGTATFPVSWSGTDEGSGIATYDVYVATGDGGFEPWLVGTTGTSAEYPGVDGVTYRFEVVATDRVGLAEEPAGVAEATTTVDVVDVVTPPGGCPPTPFVDVGGSHLFCADIAWLYVSGITVGDTLPNGDTVFRPVAPLSRQAMAAFLHRAAGSPSVGLSSPYFADIGAGHPFYDAIQWMAESGTSLGFPNPAGGKPLFRPTQVLTRQGMAAFLHRSEGEPAVPPGTPAFFADIPSGHRFYDAIQWMGHSGVSVGSPAPPGLPVYRPTDAVSRQGMAAFLHRLADL